MKMHDSQGDLTDVSAETTTLDVHADGTAAANQRANTAPAGSYANRERRSGLAEHSLIQ